MICAHCKTEPVIGKSKFCSAKCRVADHRATKKKVPTLKSTKSRTSSKKSSGKSGRAGAKTKGSASSVASVPTDLPSTTPSTLEPPSTTLESPVQPASEPQKTSASSEYDREAALEKFRAMGLDPVEWITTGIPEFDALTKIPRARITQIQGPYAVGKTTLCLNMLRGLRNKRVLYIDTEAALNAEVLVNLGINPDTFRLWNSSAFIEDIYDTVIRALEKPQFDIIIIDSLAACTFRTEAAGDAPDANIGQKAKIVNKLMRIVPMELKRTNTALVIINQERETIGGYGPIKYTPGGMGVLYAASLIVSLKTTKAARFPSSGPPFKGQSVTAEIIKSKVNDPWRKAEFKLYYGGLNA